MQALWVKPLVRGHPHPPPQSASPLFCQAEIIKEICYIFLLFLFTSTVQRVKMVQTNFRADSRLPSGRTMRRKHRGIETIEKEGYLAMSKFLDKPASDTLYRAIMQLKSEDECRSFFQDLCTVSELKAMEQRMDVAMLLDQGMIYSEILERTGASSATISRVNRCLHYGASGYQAVIPRLKEQDEE